MSEAEDKRLQAYLERESTFLGRAMNAALDTARGVVGKPSLLIPVLQYERREATKKEAAKAQAQMPIPNVPQHDFADMISSALEGSGLAPKDRVQALAVINNATVYLHQADPANRLATTATPGSIGAEWNQLGLNEAQAVEMIYKSIGQVHEKNLECRADRVADRLAVEMTRAADPQRADALALLEDLGQTMRKAEQSPRYIAGDWAENYGSYEPSENYGSQEPSENLGLWEAIDDKLTAVNKSPSALALAAEWGLTVSEYGVLRNEHGGNVRSRDLLSNIAKEKTQDLTPAQEPPQRAFGGR